MSRGPGSVESIRDLPGSSPLTRDSAVGTLPAMRSRRPQHEAIVSAQLHNADSLAITRSDGGHDHELAEMISLVPVPGRAPVGLFPVKGRPQSR